MRRVALAGVLALQPEVLVLMNQPPGLIRRGANNCCSISSLHGAGHNAGDDFAQHGGLAEVCDRLYVLADGKTLLHGSAAEVFGDPAPTSTAWADVPPVMTLFEQLRNKSLLPARCPGFYSGTGSRAVEWVVGVQ